ncbi:hypothetical protein IAU60_002026 [Kwoniella sp. DSM 27419]
MISPEEVEEQARKTLGLDEEPDQPLPPFYLPPFSELVKTHPYDTNFIVELGQPGRQSSLGGNGFGVVTCMEDHCWKDVILSADPLRPKGGLKDGFGSFSDFMDHCEEPAHIKGRTERCRKLGITFPPSSNRHTQSPTTSQHPSSRYPTSPAASSSLTSHPLFGTSYHPSSPAGPSRGSASQLAARAPTLHHRDPAGTSRQPPSSSKVHTGLVPVSSMGSVPPARMPSSPSVDHTGMLSAPSSATATQDSKPQVDLSNTLSSTYDEDSGRSPGVIEMLDESFSDDDVLVLTDDEIPEQYRKVTNRHSPIPLVDDTDTDSDEERQVRDRGKGKAVARNTSSARIPLAPIFQQAMNSSQAKIPEAVDMTRTSSDESYSTQMRKFDDLIVNGSTVKKEKGKGKAHATPAQPVALQDMQSEANKPDIRSMGPAALDRQIALLNQAFQNSNKPIVPKPSLPIATDNSCYENERLYLNKMLTGVVARRVKIQRTIKKRLTVLTYLTTRSFPQPYVPPPPDLLQVYPELRRYAPFLLEANALTVAGPSGTHNALSNGNAAAAHNPLAMPGAWDKGLKNDAKPIIPATSAGLPLAGPPGLSVDPWGLDDDPDADPFDAAYGYEYDRPRTSEGLATFFTENLKDFMEDTTVDESLKNLGLSALDQHLPNLRIQLMPHQVLGVDFMVNKEKNKKFRGGINADAMGLGKTVQTIATLALNPSQDRKVKSTLIIAPLALLSQWKSEIETKCVHGLMRVGIYHGPKRIKSANDLRSYDVVLTTYGTLTSEFGTEHKHKKKVQIVDKEASDDDDNFTVTKKQGPLFKVNWYRIVLDEAHIIRNKNTRASKACFGLHGVHRWCLTGTPIVNSLDDLYPLLHFLCISTCKQWDDFRAHISKVQKTRPKLASKRAQAILRTCSIRRTKDSELNGRKILQLPLKVTEVVRLEFTDEERQIYAAIEGKFQVRFNSFLKKGTVMKHYSIMLVMLMRLRQLTCHPWLLRRNPNSGDRHDMDVVVTDEDLFAGIDQPKTDDISELARASTLLGQEFVDRVKKALLDRQGRLEAAADANDEEATREGDCAVCYDAFNDERITPCGHSFCAACLEDIFNAPAANVDLSEEDIQAGRRKCPMCRSSIEKGRIFRAAAFLPQDDDGDVDAESDIDDGLDDDASNTDETSLALKKEEGTDETVSEYEGVDEKGKRRVSEVASRQKKRRKGKGKAENQDETPDGIAIEDVLPSTKMKRLGQLIDRIHEQDANQKIIVFSQFVEYIDLCALFLQRHGVKHVCYVGSMKQDEREETLRAFNTPADEEDSPKVILMSLKCGGVGLNLCVANHVICLDLAWNAATENQAVDRAHRIGQTRDVHVHRLVIRDTVEQRIMALQDAKQALSDGAMGEGAGGRLGRLSVRDLMRLFGVGGRADDED